MKTQRRLMSIASCGLLLASIAAMRFRGEASREVDACSLLTPAVASTALEQSSLPGKRLVNDGPTLCVWSHDPAASDSSAISIRMLTQRKPSPFTTEQEKAKEAVLAKAAAAKL